MTMLYMDTRYVMKTIDNNSYDNSSNVVETMA